MGGEIESRSARGRRWWRRVGVALAATLGVVVVLGVTLALYVRSLPWRNGCEAARTAAANASSSPATNSAVATSQPLATRAAADVLAAGGNAVDAAIAAALVLAVAEPGNSGLGGGGFALVHAPGAQPLSLDFRERAPLGLDVAALNAAVRKDASALRNGALSVAVPMEWAGLRELHRRYATLPMTRLAQPAIDAAKGGVAVGTEYAARCWVRRGALDDEAARIFATESGLCPLPGWVLVQPELARTLEALAGGASWDDVVGRKMVELLRARGSAIADADLAAAVPTERPVVEGAFMGRRIVSMGPPSSGGAIVIAWLQSYERMRKALPGADALHLWVEASRLAFFDRATLFGDPDATSVPLGRVVSPSYADAQAARVRADGPLALPADAQPREGQHTTHLSVVDKTGMAVAMTLTINVPFGSGLVVPGTGVLLNDEMDDFYVEGPNAFGLVGNEKNAPAPGKRPLSSMSPTFVFDEGGALSIVLGSPGGSGIPTAVASVLRAMIEDGASADAAVFAPRVHHQWVPDRVDVEPGFDRARLPPWLVERAHRPMFPIGRVQLVARDPQSGWRATCDCRDEGTPWAGAL